MLKISSVNTKKNMQKLYLNTNECSVFCIDFYTMMQIYMLRHVTKLFSNLLKTYNYSKNDFNFFSKGFY